MTKEITQSFTYCDCCNKQLEEPNAIAGRWDSGWLINEDYDLCEICYGLVKLKIIKQIPKKVFDEAFKQVKKDRVPKPFENFDPSIIGGYGVTLTSSNNGTCTGYSKIT